MAKKNDLKNSFTSTQKVANKPSINDIERITNIVEQQKSDTPELEEETIKTSIDFPKSLFRDMKIKLLDDRRSMKIYILDLIRKDLYLKE